MVKCVKLGREAEGLDFPPYPGALGKRIWENVSKEAWAQWLKQQTMLVNENRLNLADQRARKYLMEQTERHFFGAGADVASGYVPPARQEVAEQRRQRRETDGRATNTGATPGGIDDARAQATRPTPARGTETSRRAPPPSRALPARPA